MRERISGLCRRQYYFIWLFMAALHYIIGNYMMQDLYAYRLTDIFKYGNWFLLRTAFFIGLCMFYRFLCFWFCGKNKIWISVTLFFILLQLGLLVLIWPGIWRWDEFFLLLSALLLKMMYWQNYLTSLYYIFSLMFIPVCSAPIIVMILINSCIAGYIVAFFMGKWGKPAVLTGIPFLFFPVLDSNLYPMRMSICAFLELLLLVRLYRYSAEEKKPRQFVPVMAVAAIVTVWRSESLYYLVFFPIVFWIMFQKQLLRKKTFFMIAVYWCIAAALFIPQYYGNTRENKNTYDLTSVMLPIVPLTERVNECGEYDSLNILDQVIDVEMTLDAAGKGIRGIDLWNMNPEFVRDYSGEQYRRFRMEYYKLILKHPVVFLKERCHCFLNSYGFIHNTAEIFDMDDNEMYTWFRSLPHTAPLNKEIRKKGIGLLELKENPLFYPVYSVILPIVLLLSLIVGCVMKKKIKEAALLTLAFLKAPLIFLTAPDSFFMYYYAVYLIGYVAVFIYAAYRIHDGFSKKRA